MAQKDKFKFFICDNKNKPKSSIWFISSRNNHIYISAIKIGGAFKLSIHPEAKDSKVCQIGIINDYAKNILKKGFLPPKPIRWTRPITPEKGAVSVISIFFPTNYLNGKLNINNLEDFDYAFKIAKRNCAVRIDIFYSKNKPPFDVNKKDYTILKKYIKLSFDKFEQVKVIELPSKEFVLITARYVNFNISIPNFHKKFTLLKENPSFKNLSAILFSKPEDGKLITLAEINGLKIIK
ncbi:MAG: hypothetical protein WC472_02130 [Candidatus Paceibacterota bacterium]